LGFGYLPGLIILEPVPGRHPDHQWFLPASPGGNTGNCTIKENSDANASAPLAIDAVRPLSTFARFHSKSFMMQHQWVSMNSAGPTEAFLYDALSKGQALVITPASDLVWPPRFEPGLPLPFGGLFLI
jgi:hypothetical protein